MNKLKEMERILKSLKPDEDYKESMRLIDKIDVPMEKEDDMDEQIRKSLKVPKLYQEMIRKGKAK